MVTKHLKYWAVFFLVFGGFYANLFAQPMSVLKAQSAFEKQKFTKCIKLAVKGLKKDKTLTELYYIKSQAEFALSELPDQKNEKINYDKECVKSAIKAIAKDKDKEYSDKYKELFNKIAQKNNKLAIEIFNQAKYEKALPYFKNSYEISNDTIAYGMTGVCNWFNKDKKEALKIMQTVAKWNYDAFTDGVHKSTYLVQAFEILAAYFTQTNQLDTAIQFAEMGLDIFPTHYNLLQTEKYLINRKINEIKSLYGITTVVNEFAKRGLNYLPNDSFYLSLQNTFYLYQIGYLLNRNNFLEAEQMHHEFFESKKDLLSRKCKNKSDNYLTSDSMQFITKCFEHYISLNQEKAMVYYFYKWYPLYFKSQPINEIGLEYILRNPPTNVAKRLIMALMNHAGRTYPKNLKFKEYRYQTFVRWMKEPIKQGEWNGYLKLSDSVRKDFPKKIELTAMRESLLSKAIDSFTHYQQPEFAWLYLHKLQTEFPQNKDLDRLYKTLAISDFEIRYKGSKVYVKKLKNGQTQALTGWNGFSKRCDIGTLPDSTTQKITNRLNYFRQAAGLRDVIFPETEKMSKCAEAAVMFAPIGVFTREPTPETHSCYSKNAAEAALLGQMVKDPNPSISATVLMSDEKSEELYNRQWILAPNALTYGYGVAENNSVFWMLRPGDKIPDSAYYNSHFICWPPIGYVHSMFLFEKWSFATNADLSKAKVTVISKKYGPIPTKTQFEKAPLAAFGTLIMIPELDEMKIKAIKDSGDTFTFKIVLEGQKKREWNYTSTVFK